MLLLVVSALALPVIPKPEPPVVSAPWPMVRSCTSAGLAIYVASDEPDGVASVVTVVEAGMRYEPPGKAGLAHLFEHLWYRSRARPGESVREVVDRVGVHNAYTDPDTLTFAVEGAPDELDAMLALQGAFFTDPLAGVGEAEFAAERAVVQRELESGDDEFGRSAVRYVFPRLFPAPHPYAQAYSEHSGGVAALTLADVREFAAARVRPELVSLYVRGAPIGSVEETLVRVLPARVLSATLAVPCPATVERGPEPGLPLAPAPLVSRSPSPPRVVVGFAVPGGWAGEHDLAELAIPVLEYALASGFGGRDLWFWPTCSLVAARLGSAVLCEQPVDDDAQVAVASTAMASGLRMLQDPDRIKYFGAGPDRFGGARVGAQLAILRTHGGRTAPVTHHAIDAYRAAHTDRGGHGLDARLAELSSFEWGHVTAFAQRWFTKERAVWATVLSGSNAAAVPSAVVRTTATASRVEVSAEAVRKRALQLELRTERLASGVEVVLLPDSRMSTARVELVVRGGAGAEPVRGLMDVTAWRETWYARNMGYDPSALARAEGVVPYERSGPREVAFVFDLAPAREGRIFPMLVRRLGAVELLDSKADPAEVVGLATYRASDGGDVVRRLAAQRLYGAGVFPVHADWSAAQRLGDPRLLQSLLAMRRPEWSTVLGVGNIDAEALLVEARAALGTWPARLPPAPTPLPPLVAQKGDARRGVYLRDERRGGVRLAAACDPGADRFPAERALALWLDERANLVARERAGLSYGLRVAEWELAATPSFTLLSGDVEPVGLGSVVAALVGELTSGAQTVTDADARRLSWLAATRERLLASSPRGLALVLRERALASDRDGWFSRRADAYAAFDGAALRRAISTCADTFTWAALGPQSALDSLAPAGLVAEGVDLDAWWRTQIGDDAWDKVSGKR